MGCDVVIRPATADDAAALASLHARCFAEAWDAAAFAALLAAFGAIGRVAVARGEIGGFALLRVVAGEGEVITFAIAPEHRRRGLGAALLRDGVAAAAGEGAGRIVLEVAADNAAAQALYRCHGFTAAGRRRRYYGGADADILALSITPAA